MRSVIALFFFCATTALAQPYLVKDINTTGPINGSSYPGQLVPLGASLYFASSGRETSGLWRLDAPTTAPVQLIKGSIIAVTPFRGRLLVATYGGLMMIDGQSVAQISDAVASTSSTMFEAAGRVAFVRSNNDLWSTDGTRDGTARIDFHPQSTASTNARLLGTFGGRVVFVSSFGVGITDGTTAGTTILIPSITYAGNVVVAGDRFFFAGLRNSSSYDGSMWVSDGTPAGTHAVPTGSNVGLSDITVPVAAMGGNRVVFWLSKAIYVSDGTAAGTTAVANVYNVSYLCTVLNGIVYFLGSESTFTTGTLWRTDGTSAGTQAVATLPERYVSGMSTALGRIWMTSYETDNGVLSRHFSVSTGTSIRVLTSNDALHPVVEWSGRAYFSGNDRAHGYELWSSDGTPEGTALVFDLEPNIAPSSVPRAIAASATHAIFAASADSKTRETWSSDGTAQGTQPFPFTIYRSLKFGDFVYFTRDDARTDLYRTDGTPDGTQKVYTFPNAAYPVVATDDLLYVNSGASIWATDGTPGGTVAVSGSVYSNAINLAGRLVYADGYGALYERNGRQPPRLLATEIGASIAVAGGRIFSFRSGTLLVSDGTAEIRQLATFDSAFPLGAIGDRLLFAASDPSRGTELWSTDGTPAGTQLVRAINPGAMRSINRTFAVMNDRVLFVADDGTFGMRIWSSDGTAGGTIMLPAMSYDDPVVAKGRAFFAANDPLTGMELWQTDGTVEGTHLVADIYGGPSWSSPSDMMLTRDALFFQATTLESGTELWALPLPGRTIAINDARAPNGATTATMTVSLDGAATQPVTATWSSTTGASGTIAFAPGETKKSITFAITADPVTRANRFDHVRLGDIRGAIAARSFGTVIEEGRAPLADLSLSIGPDSTDNRRRAIIVTNHGPDTVPIATITYRQSSYTPTISYSTSVLNIAPGASTSVPFSINGVFTATVSSPTADPDPTNNSFVAFGTISPYAALSISIAPAVLVAGSHATLTIGSSPGPVSLTSSDPSVIAVPPTASTGNIDVVALAPGRTTLTASITGTSVAIDVAVAAAGTTYRWPSQMTFTIDGGDRTFGTPQHLVAKIPSWAWDVDHGPTGPVTFYEGDAVVAVAYVNPSSVAETFVDSLLPGPHTIRAVYPGDAHFLGTTAPAQTITIVKPAPVTFYGTYDPRSATTALVTIVVVAPRARPATGTITLKNYDEVLAANLTFAGSVSVVTKRIPFVTIFYSGDDFYEPAVVSVTLSPVRHRAAP